MNICLRVVVLSMLVSCSAIAIGDSKDSGQNAVTEISAGHAIVNAFISDPTIGERLREDGLFVSHMTRQLIQPGVTEFVLHVHTCPMCNPVEAKSGFVTIIEDVRPTYMDAPVKYSVSFSIEEKN
jgi:hypothetical protein